MIKPEFTKRDIRSFVIRGGRMTSAQEAGLENSWQQFGLSINNGRLNFAQCFSNQNPVILEIGYGMGDSLLEMATNNPKCNFVGVEVHPPGVGRLINEANKRKLANLKTYCADAIDVLEKCIAPDSLRRVQLYFPDPWHKKRHHKRRIVQPHFVDLVERSLEKSGVFHLCTDWQQYAEHMVEVLDQAERLINMKREQPFSERPAWRPITKFEKRGENLGHAVFDLLYEKVGE